MDAPQSTSKYFFPEGYPINTSCFVYTTKHLQHIQLVGNTVFGYTPECYGQFTLDKATQLHKLKHGVVIKEPYVAYVNRELPASVLVVRLEQVGTTHRINHICYETKSSWIAVDYKQSRIVHVAGDNKLLDADATKQTVTVHKGLNADYQINLLSFYEELPVFPLNRSIIGVPLPYDVGNKLLNLLTSNSFHQYLGRLTEIIASNKLQRQMEIQEQENKHKLAQEQAQAKLAKAQSNQMSVDSKEPASAVGQCCICLDAQATYALSQCHHLVYCEACYALPNLSLVCPICRKDNPGAMKIYLS